MLVKVNFKHRVTQDMTAEELIFAITDTFRASAEKEGYTKETIDRACKKIGEKMSKQLENKSVLEWLFSLDTAIPKWRIITRGIWKLAARFAYAGKAKVNAYIQIEDINVNLD